MSFCSYEDCGHYFSATRYSRKCYYEPQCWRGFLDIVLKMQKLKLPEKLKRKRRESLPEHGRLQV